MFNIKFLFPQSTPPLESITANYLTDQAFEIKDNEVPQHVKKHLNRLYKRKENITKNFLNPCMLCGEVHLFNLRTKKLENAFLKLK